MPKRWPRKFDDLPDNVKQEVLERYRDFEVDRDRWWDMEIDGYKEDNKAKGIDIEHIYFDLYDRGCEFDGYLHVAKFIETEVKGLIEAGADIMYLRWQVLEGCSCCHIKCSSRAPHRNGIDIDLELEYPDGMNEGEIERHDELFSEYILEALRNVSDKILKSLENEYEFLTSDEALTETFRANDYRFDREGVIQ